MHALRMLGVNMVGMIDRYGTDLRQDAVRRSKQLLYSNLTPNKLHKKDNRMSQVKSVPNWI